MEMVKYSTKMDWSPREKRRERNDENLISRIDSTCLVKIVLCYWYHVTQYNQPLGQAVGD